MEEQIKTCEWELVKDIDCLDRSVSSLFLRVFGASLMVGLDIAGRLENLEQVRQRRDSWVAELDLISSQLFVPIPGKVDRSIQDLGVRVGLLEWDVQNLQGESELQGHDEVIKDLELAIEKLKVQADGHS